MRLSLCGLRGRRLDQEVVLKLEKVFRRDCFAGENKDPGHNEIGSLWVQNDYTFESG